MMCLAGVIALCPLPPPRMLHGEECLAQIQATAASLFTSQSATSTAGEALVMDRPVGTR